MNFINKFRIPARPGPVRPAAKDSVQRTAARSPTARVDHLHLPGGTGYDALDRRLIDTFPASDAVTCY